MQEMQNFSGEGAHTPPPQRLDLLNSSRSEILPTLLSIMTPIWHLVFAVIDYIHWFIIELTCDIIQDVIIASFTTEYTIASFL